MARERVDIVITYMCQSSIKRVFDDTYDSSSDVLSYFTLVTFTLSDLATLDQEQPHSFIKVINVIERSISYFVTRGNDFVSTHKDVTLIMHVVSTCDG